MLPSVAGIDVGFAACGIKRARRADVALFHFPVGAACAAVFTCNRFAAAPVIVAREHLALARSRCRAWLVNSGNANCGTGAAGLAAARSACRAVARQLDCPERQVLPFSTGVIMEPLPAAKLIAGAKLAGQSLAGGNWHKAAQAIMTTDTRSKTAACRLKLGKRHITITGIAKGAGMVHPQMATMLAFIGTDARVPAAALRNALRAAVDGSFNQISIDGDTSTNDAVALAATGHAGPLSQTEMRKWTAALNALCAQLAGQIVADGEGATCTATVAATGFATNALCRQVADSVACSPLIKTMLHARDPNLGRLLMAVGKVPGDYDPGAIRIRINGKLAFARNRRAGGFSEQAAQQALKQSGLRIDISAGRKTTSAEVTFCDLSAQYVRINADYRS